MKGWRGLLVLLAVLAACDDSVSFRLRLEWKRATGDDAAQACPTLPDGRYSCEAIPLTCDVRVRVRIVGASNDETYYSECFRIENNGDACLLADLPISPRAIPNEMVRVQVIAWTLEELEASGIDLSLTDGCPVTTPFELSGLPRLHTPPTEQAAPREPVPALGGEEYFHVGQSPVATVTLGCPQWDSLNALVCRDNSVTVEATIRDPRTFSSVLRSQADIMEVRFGQPEPNGDGSFRVNFESFSQGLARTPSGALLWHAILPEVPTGVACLRAEAQNVSGPTISCFDVPAPVDDVIRPDGFLIGRTTYQAMLRLVDPPGVLPEQGVVLGVVIDSNGQAVQGATVSGSGGATVIYPGDTEDTFAAVRSDTGPKGYFFSPDAAYDTVWTADGPGSLVDDGTARGGIVDNHATLVVVRLNGAAPQMFP